MNCLICPLCNTLKDSDFVGCNAVTAPAISWNYELICGDSYEWLPEFFPEGEREGVLVDGKPVNWKEWE